jgi:hypothetical protein
MTQLQCVALITNSLGGWECFRGDNCCEMNWQEKLAGYFGD